MKIFRSSENNLCHLTPYIHPVCCGRDRTDLDEDGEGEVEIEVRCEGGGRGGEAVVTHRRHRPVEEHRAGSTEQRNNQWTLQY